jgi:prevent-host-death family protein
MSRAPDVVTVSDLRRETAHLIERARKSEQPIFVTQYGYVTAVLLSRNEFDIMCVLRDRGLKGPTPVIRVAPASADANDADMTQDWDE